MKTFGEVLVEYNATDEYHLDVNRPVRKVTPCSGGVWCGGEVKFYVELLREKHNPFDYVGDGWSDCVMLSQKGDGTLHTAISA